MNYLILITEESKPVLVEVPQKPENYNNKSRAYDFERIAYDQAITAAISDKSKHIQFKDGQDNFIRRILPLSMFVEELNQSLRFPYKVGQTFPLPENISVSFEEECSIDTHPEFKSVCKNIENCVCVHDGTLRKLAILSPVVAPSEEVKHFLLGKKIRYRYVDWEEGSFTPWSPCTERELKTILEDQSIEIVQFKP